MAYDYDKLYANTPQALGKPTQVFVDFFNTYQGPRLKVLDIGCGQGRDALFIARLEHSVVGVDMSSHGVEEMLEIAGRSKLMVKGVVEDIRKYQSEETFDVVLIDRTLHMLPLKESTKVLRYLIGCLNLGGWLLISDEKSNMPAFKRVIDSGVFNWDVELEQGGHLFLRKMAG